jgi:hypothetical protein
MWPLATSLLPSAEHATEPQEETGEGCAVHIAPELVEVYMEPSAAKAIVFVPSAEQANEDHTFAGAAVGVQVWAFMLATVHRSAKGAASGGRSSFIRGQGVEP